MNVINKQNKLMKQIKNISKKQSTNQSNGTPTKVQEDPFSPYIKNNSQKQKSSIRPSTSKSPTKRYSPNQSKSIIGKEKMTQFQEERQKQDPNIKMDYEFFKMDGFKSWNLSKQEEQAKVVAHDQRKPIKTLQHPYNSIARLLIEFPNSQIKDQKTNQIKYVSDQIVGCAVLISPRVALTCAHNIYSTKIKKEAKNIRFFIGIQDNGQIKNIQVKVKNWTIRKQYKQYKQKQLDEQRKYDIGIILLQQNKVIGWDRCLKIKWDYNYSKDSQKLVKIVGYHSQYQSIFLNKQMHEQDKVIKNQNDGFLWHQHTTQKGYSGTGLLIKQKGSDRYKVIGIHRSSCGGENFALLFNSTPNTSETINQLFQQLQVQDDIKDNYICSKSKLQKQNQTLLKLNSKLSQKYQILKDSIKGESNIRQALQDERKQKQFFKNQSIKRQLQINQLQKQKNQKLNQILLLNQRLIGLQLENKRLSEQIQLQKLNTLKNKVIQVKKNSKEEDRKFQEISDYQSLFQFQNKLSYTQNIEKEQKNEQNKKEEFFFQQENKKPKNDQKNQDNKQQEKNKKQQKNDVKDSNKESDSHESTKTSSNEQYRQQTVQKINQKGCLQTLKRWVKVIFPGKAPNIQIKVDNTHLKLPISQSIQSIQQALQPLEQMIKKPKHQFIEYIQQKNGKYKNVKNQPNFKRLILNGLTMIKIQSLVFYNWSELKQLNLSNCGLVTDDWRKLSEKGQKFQNLKILYLHSNKIHKVQLNQLQKFNNLTDIYFKYGIFSGNPLHQDSIKNIEKFIHKNFNKRIIKICL